jgi:ubiquinone/menaquinone biosynthesis C-methylase UbiE
LKSCVPSSDPQSFSMNSETITEEIKTFWNTNPVDNNFVAYKSEKAFYKEYDNFRYKTQGHILKELDRIDFKDKKVLEIGLGQGADSSYIIQRGAKFSGIDLTEESVRRLEERFDLFDIPYESLKIGNATQLPYEDNSFEIIYSHGVLHHSPYIEKIVDEIYRVLKPGGKCVVMLYHKNSVNYYISISLIRRIGLLTLYFMPPFSYLISKMTGESRERILKHTENLKKSGIGYLKMKNFLNVSTDGPENIYSSVWSKKTATKLFSKFKNFESHIHFLNERHLLGFQRLLLKRTKKWIASKFGWHLWILVNK